MATLTRKKTPAPRLSELDRLAGLVTLYPSCPSLRLAYADAIREAGGDGDTQEGIGRDLLEAHRLGEPLRAALEEAFPGCVYTGDRLEREGAQGYDGRKAADLLRFDTVLYVVVTRDRPHATRGWAPLGLTPVQGQHSARAALVYQKCRQAKFCKPARSTYVTLARKTP